MTSDAAAKGRKSMGRKWRRGQRFAGGFAVGFVAIPIGLAAMAVAVLLLFAGWEKFGLHGPHDGRSQPPDVAMLGSDVSQSRGQVVILRGSELAARVDCRDACDDLSLVRVGELQAVRVLDGQGACVVCREGFWTWLTPATWTLAGRPALKLTERRAG